MGKGDKRSKRGKINQGTFGKRRAKKAQKFKPAPVTYEKTKKTEVKEEPVVTEVKAEKKKTTRKKTTKKDTDKEKE